MTLREGGSIYDVAMSTGTAGGRTDEGEEIFPGIVVTADVVVADESQHKD